MRHYQPRRSRLLWWVAAVVLVLPLSLIQAVVFLTSWLLLGVVWSGGMALVTSGCLIGLLVLRRAGRAQAEDQNTPWVPVPRPRGERYSEWDDLIWGGDGPDLASTVRPESRDRRGQRKG